MNLFAIVLKQMRQRLLATVLTVLSVVVGVAMATGIMIMNREGQRVFAQTDYGFDMIVGPKAAPLQLVTSIVYQIDAAPGTIPWEVYEQMTTAGATTQPSPYRGRVQWAVPIALGDTYKSLPIVGTSTTLFGVDDDGNRLPDDKVPTYRPDQRFALAEGRAFHPRKFEAVVGAEAARRAGLNIGSTFHATHGNDETYGAAHDEEWRVVGILERTGTAFDRSIFVPLVSFWAIADHAEGLEAIDKAREKHGVGHDHGHDPKAKDDKDEHDHAHGHAYHMHGDEIHLDLSEDLWEVSAILVKSRSASALNDLRFTLRNHPLAAGVSPASVMQQFFDNTLGGMVRLLVAISTLVTLVAGIGILVSIYNSVVARNREIAILRALGATRGKIVSIICAEAFLVGLVGTALGLVGGHLLAAAASNYLQHWVGAGLTWYRIGPDELLYAAAVLGLATLAGLVPALRAYRTDVASNLA